MRQHKEEELELNLQLKSLMQDLRCQSYNPIQRVCNNPNCQQFALHCSFVDCEHCHIPHQNCGSYLFEKFTKEVQKKTAGIYSQFYEKMSQIESNFIQKINKSKKRFLYAFSIDRLSNIIDKQFYSMIDSVYRLKNTEAITGQEAHELFKKLLQPEIDQECREAQLLKVFQQKTNKLLKEYLSNRDWIFDSMHGHYKDIPRPKQRQKKQIQRMFIDSNALKAYRNNIKLQDLLNYPSQKVQMFSNIIKQQIQKMDCQFIFAQLNKPSSLDLVFRATQHHFSAKEFHHLCDGIDGTLVLARNQYDKVIGGFTPLNWFGQGFKADTSNQTIIFGVNQKVKMNLSNPLKAIYCDRNTGPTFGGQALIFNMLQSHDFSISDECNKNKKSTMNFPRSYRFKGRPVETESICGLKKGGNFGILQYEIYKVVYSQKKS